MIQGQSITNNITLPSLGNFVERGTIDSNKEVVAANEYREKLSIRCYNVEQDVSKLSGGNQQKVCIAKAVVFEPDMLFVSEPTRGIDIGAKKVILDYLLTLNREKGITIVITSSELVELRSLCDRIAVVYDGRVKSVLKPTDSDETFGLLMSGLDAVEVQ